MELKHLKIQRKPLKSIIWKLMKIKDIASLTKTTESEDNGMMKENKCQPRILCPIKISSKNKDKI